MYTLNCNGKLLVIDCPLVMGIINVTPDSFYKPDADTGTDNLVKRAAAMIRDGAAILDIGGQSTRPGSDRVSAADELKRVIPVIEAISHHYPDVILSVDTYHSEVAKLAVKAGARMINDISAGNIDNKIIVTAARLNVPYLCVHMQGLPHSMQSNPVYDDVVKNVLDFFIGKINECRLAGIKDVLVDPGFGFGKTITHNFKLLKGLKVFSMLDRPIVAGISRKRTIYKTLDKTAAEALNGTTALNTIALMNGANLLRVHDVKEASEAIRLFSAYKQA